MIDFALSITGSIGRFESNLDLKVPGVVTGLKSHGQHRGLLALMELPIAMIGLRPNAQEEASKSKHPEVPVSEEAVCGIDGTESGQEWAASRQDSGFLDIDPKSEVIMEKAPQSNSEMRPRAFNKKISVSSLPPGQVIVPPIIRKQKSEFSLPLSWNGDRGNNSADDWKELAADGYQEPTATLSSSKSRLQELLIDAIVLLQEAESTGFNLDSVDWKGKCQTTSVQ